MEIELRTILVPIDFSANSLRGLDQALAMARQFSANIEVVHVVPDTVPAELSHIGIVLLEKRMAAEAQKKLEQIARKHPDFALTTHVLRGSVAFSIVRLAATRKVDLIIAATHGYTGLKHTLLGSVAERIVRHAPCPVLTVHQTQAPTGPLRFERVLVPVDFSENSSNTIGYALALAKPGSGSWWMTFEPL